MLTGGVHTNKEDIQKCFKAGACCVGMGSKLITKYAFAVGGATPYVKI